MKLAIVGYGSMGHEIEFIARKRGHQCLTVDPAAGDADAKELVRDSLFDVQVALDFTHPASVMENIRFYTSHSLNAVIGTTGWHDHLAEVTKLVNESGIGLIWGANFSIGVNLFCRIIGQAAQLMDRIDDYDVYIHEDHHKRKADSPSGTAGMLEKIILNRISRKKRAVHECLNHRIAPDEMHVTSTRAGSIPGRHIVGFDSDADSIELIHTARNRSGFALGAVLAAEFIKDRRGFLGVEDMMDCILTGQGGNNV
ncbi:MAG: 4-hydroxy-tetrahydrodipicolinate reductase [Candidatus Wallbacteria bacterium]|nr:4-hydroxy-tetrahydrodipicolinate reductase [Candidatus Wallbacteria bacterium]